MSIIEGSDLQQRVSVSLSFADADIGIAEKIIQGLIEKNVRVCTDNVQLRTKSETWGVHKFNLIDDLFSEDIQYCILLISKNYHAKKWTSYYKCKLLETAISRHNFILPVKIAENVQDIPGVTVLLDALVIKPEEFQIVIDTFFRKIKQGEKTEIFEIRGYASIEKVLKLYNSKNKLSKLEAYLEKSEQIGYELYESIDPLIDSSRQYFLYLYEGIREKKTYDHIYENHPNILKSKSLIILIPKEKKQKILDRRKNNIKEIFGPSAIFYIDEFIWLFCTNEDFRKDTNKFPVQNYIDPSLKEKSDTALTFLNDWLTRENNPVLVIKGSGGIGKTTLVKKFSNTIHETVPNTKILYINSSQIISEIYKYSEVDRPVELYDLYRAWCNSKDDFNDDYKLSYDLFRMNIDNGHIIIIIDGLDEIITHYKLFDIDNFLASISNYSNEIGNGKVILTCRNYFWDKKNPEMINFETIELLPFNTELTRQYFAKRFNSIEKAIKKGFKIARNLLKIKSEDDEEEFIPFVLDTVSYIIEQELDDSPFEDPTFQSELLDINIKNDYILYKICYRERERVAQTLEVDSQIKFFIKFAIDYNSIIKLDEIKFIFEELFNKKNNDSLIEAIKVHPLLQVNSEVLTFKYDFFEELFKNIFLGQLFDNKINVDLNVLKILAENSKFNSAFIDDIVTGIGEFNEGKLLEFIDITERILELDLNGSRESLKNEAIAGLFVTALKAIKKRTSLDIVTSTDLLKNIFYKEGFVENLAINKLSATNSEKIIFDFSDLKFRNCFFADYDYFWECRFNKNTNFENCSFAHLYKKDEIATDANIQNFNLTNCRMDESVEKVLRKSSEDFTNQKIKIISAVKGFLKLFCKHGLFRAVREDVLKSNHSKILKNLLNMDLLAEYESSKATLGRQFKISNKYENEIMQFCENGTMSNKLKEVIVFLLEKKI